MAASYLRRGMVGPATFSLFVRRLPPGRGFLVAAGLEDCLGYLESFAFAEEDLAWLLHHGFDAAAVDAFAQLRFTGDVHAVPEGRVVLPDEPILEVTAPIAEAQLVETFLLNQVTHQTANATKAARCVLAAGDRIELVDFALRRTHGVDAGMAVARLCAMAGFAATSNVEAARLYDLPAAGTMAHSYVEAFPSGPTRSVPMPRIDRRAGRSSWTRTTRSTACARRSTRSVKWVCPGHSPCVSTAGTCRLSPAGPERSSTRRGWRMSRSS